MSDKKTTHDEGDLTKDYDVLEPVPMESRSYNKISMFLMWFGANAKPGNWFIGSTFGVCGFFGAMIITIIGSGFGYLFNVAIGIIGFTTGLATFALTRMIFGVNGSRVFSILNACSFIGWCFINGIVAAYAMDAIGQALLGSSNLRLCGFIMGVLQGVAVIYGREAVRKVGVIGSTILIFASVFICIVVIKMLPAEEFFKPMTEEASGQIGTMLSMCIGVNLAWAPAAADFGRYAKDRATSGWISYAALVFSSILFYMTGSMSFMATGTYDPANQLLDMGLGWPFLLIIIILTVTTNVVNLYTGGMSLQNAFKEKLTPRKAVVILAVIQIPFTTTYELLDHAQTVFNYLAYLFGPVFVILLVDFYLVRKKEIDIPQLNKKGGIYWYTGGFNIGYIVIDLIGVALYFIFQNTGLFASNVGEMIPMMAVVAVLAYVYGKSQLSSGKMKLKADDSQLNNNG